VAAAKTMSGDTELSNIQAGAPYTHSFVGVLIGRTHRVAPICTAGGRFAVVTPGPGDAEHLHGRGRHVLGAPRAGKVSCPKAP
jgi:hypothetical protein